MFVISFICVPVKWMEKCIVFFVHQKSKYIIQCLWSFLFVFLLIGWKNASIFLSIKKSVHHSIFVIIFICVTVKLMEYCTDFFSNQKLSASFAYHLLIFVIIFILWPFSLLFLFNWCKNALSICSFLHIKFSYNCNSKSKSDIWLQIMQKLHNCSNVSFCTVEQT
jgi:hypothetical protein